MAGQENDDDENGKEVEIVQGRVPQHMRSDMTLVEGNTVRFGNLRAISQVLWSTAIRSTITE